MPQASYLSLPLGLWTLWGFASSGLSQSPTPSTQDLAPFHAPVVLLEEDEARFQLLVDLDDDGATDVVGSRIRTDGLAEIVVWQNTAGTLNRVFTTTTTLPGAGGAYRSTTLHMAAGDIDGDGDVDVIGGAGGGSVHLFNIGNFQMALVPYSHPGEVRDVATGDIDGDGIDDAITVSSHDSFLTQKELQVRTQNNVYVSSDFLVREQHASVHALDADGDGDLEVAVCSNKFVRIFDLQNGNLVATSFLTTAQTSDQRTMWDAGDLDGDGDVDLVGFEPTSGTFAGPRVHVVRNTGSNLVVEPDYRGGPAEYLADIDGDGDLDGICCGGGSGGGGPTWPTFGSSRFEFALNEGGAFQESVSFPGFGSVSMAGMADLNGDGHLDAVAGACVFYGVGPWDRQPMPKTWARPSPSLALLSDADGDGDIDIGRRMEGGGGQNIGNGFFTPGASQIDVLPTGTFATFGGFVGDFDGDGDVDEIRTLFTNLAAPTFAGMAFLENNGSGVLRYSGVPTPPGERIGSDESADEALVADLDDDGDLDCMGSRDPALGPRHTRLFRNDGTGFFTPWIDYPGERLEQTGDFDGDGRTDLLMSTDAGAGSLHLRLGTGASPAFGSPLALFPGARVSEVQRVSAVDANDDGRIDVLVANTSGPVRIYDNLSSPGSPAFGPSPLGYPTLRGQGSVIRTPIRVDAFDVNGDGHTDLVMGPIDTADFLHRIYIRKAGAGTSVETTAYDDPITQVIPNGFPADVDGDGDVDIAGYFVTFNPRVDNRDEFKVQYGAGTAGEAGVTPLLGASGSFVAGGTKMLHLRGVTGPTLGILAIGFGEANLANLPVPGVTLLLDPGFLLTQTVQVGAPGNDLAEGGLDYPVFLPPSVAGYEFFDQVFLLDPAGPSGVSASNGLHVRIRS